MTTLRTGNDPTPRLAAPTPVAPHASTGVKAAPTSSAMQADSLNLAAATRPQPVRHSPFDPTAELGSPRDPMSRYGAYATMGGSAMLAATVGAWAAFGAASPVVLPLLIGAGVMLAAAAVIAPLSFTVSGSARGADNSAANKLKNVSIYAGMGATVALGTTLFATVGSGLAVATGWGGLALVGVAAVTGVASYLKGR